MGPILMGTHVTSVSHRVLLYVVVPHVRHVRDGWDLFQREPTVASMSRHVLPYVDVPHCVYAR
jgi:adenylate cyclase